MNRFFFIGDLHGDTAPIGHLDKEVNLDGLDWVILLGDSGINYWANRPNRMKVIKEEFGCFPCKFFVIRGNHEERAEKLAATDPDAWEITLLADGIMGLARREKEFPNIYYALDVPSVYRINGYSTLVLPGAYSVDKFYRLERHYNWFENEQLSDAEQVIGRELAYLSDHYDFILSHTCPIEYEPTDLFLPMIDQTTVDKTMELYFSDINKITKSNFWIFGHYHATRVYPLRPGEGQKIMLFQNAIEMSDILKGNYWATI